MSNLNLYKTQPTVVAVYVICKKNDFTKYLLLRRAGFLEGVWQTVTGKVKENETAITAAKRELFEETGIIFDQLYLADFVDSYFDPRLNCVIQAPVFIAFINSFQEVKLSSAEHDQYKWLDFDEALNHLSFFGQITGLRHIEEYFVRKKPNKHLLLEKT
jgi:dATP pyrophosphohydrolase